MHLNEQQVIELAKKSFILRDPDVVNSIGDDAAVILYNNTHYLVFTSDVLVENVHFKFDKISPYYIGRKAVAVNISDISAMGALPSHCLVSIGMPEAETSIIKGILLGIKRITERFGVSVIGGNTSRSEILFIDIFMVGKVKKKDLKLRSTARPGDCIFVTGKLGGSQGKKHFLFEPRLKEVQSLIKTAPISSLMDISDGLSSDIIKLAQASGVGIKLFLDKLPLSSQLLKKGISKQQAIERALYDGEDYEMLFTLPCGMADKIPGKINGTKISLIGEIAEKKEYYGIFLNKKVKLLSKGFDHFSQLTRKI